MILCGNNALKQKTVKSFMDYYVHALLYNAAKHILTLYDLKLSRRQDSINSSRAISRVR
jgi:predicted nuclease of restriction endonuclease-like (RecB) superfamily